MVESQMVRKESKYSTSSHMRGMTKSMMAVCVAHPRSILSSAETRNRVNRAEESKSEKNNKVETQALRKYLSELADIELTIEDDIAEVRDIDVYLAEGFHEEFRAQSHVHLIALNVLVLAMVHGSWGCPT